MRLTSSRLNILSLSVIALLAATTSAGDPPGGGIPSGPDSGMTRKSRTTAVLFVLDISNSMSRGPITRVKQTITQVASSVSPETGLGLISFWGCKETDNNLDFPLATGADNQKSLIQVASAIQTKHGTNIYSALMLAEKEIQRVKDWCVNVILLSDGFENCGPGDFRSVVGRIVGQHGSGCNAVHTISVSTMGWENKVLKEISELGHGSHQEVEEEKEIEVAITKVVEAVKHTQKVKWAGDGKPAEKKEGEEAPKTDDTTPPAEAPAPDGPPPAPAEAPIKKQKENGKQ
ncbi:MAG: VWA domain-containing protein [Bacteriovoracia bacterium]